MPDVLRFIETLSQISTRLIDKTRVEELQLEFFLENPGLVSQQVIDALTEESYDFTTPGGRLRFRGDFKDLLVFGMGFRTITQAKQDLILDSIVQIFEDRNASINRASKLHAAFMASGGEDEEALQDMNAEKDRWTGLWPEFDYTSRAISQRMFKHLETADEDQVERFIGNLPRAFRKMGIALEDGQIDYLRTLLSGIDPAFETAKPGDLDLPGIDPDRLEKLRNER